MGCHTIIYGIGDVHDVIWLFIVNLLFLNNSVPASVVFNKIN